MNSVASVICILYAFILVVGCRPTQRSSATYPYLGVMTDQSYGGLVTPGAEVRRLNANGNAVSMSQFAGRFVWADYAASWCQPCVSQSQAIAALEKTGSSKMTYLTILTGKSSTYDDVPDVFHEAAEERFVSVPKRHKLLHVFDAYYVVNDVNDRC